MSRSTWGGSPSLSGGLGVRWRVPHWTDYPRALPSYGQIEMVLKAAAAGGSGASKFHNPAPSTSNTTHTAKGPKSKCSAASLR